MIQVRDKWFRILIVVIPFLVITYTNGLWSGVTTKRVLSSLVSLACLVLASESVRLISYRSRVWFPHFRRWRLLFVITAGIFSVTFLLAASAVLRKFIQHGSFELSLTMDTYVTMNDKKLVLGLVSYSFLNALVNGSILLILYDVLYHYGKLRHAEKEQERLEKEKLRAELQQLKGIINPHFLFNNLNSLSSLINEDPQRAESFLDELTKVFRYLLRNNETELTTLAQELQFIQSYYHLLQTRYGKGINLEMAIDKNYEGFMIPPLTLQLLVENAFKHNQLSAERPLHISIGTAPGNKLLVSNTICKREGKVESTGIGLQNINARYGMLKQPGVVINKNEETFTAVISLI